MAARAHGAAGLPARGRERLPERELPVAAVRRQAGTEGWAGNAAPRDFALRYITYSLHLLTYSTYSPRNAGRQGVDRLDEAGTD